ncbi:MAG: HEPN domain-containing protein [candidate division WOR-3 bacterium]
MKYKDEINYWLTAAAHDLDVAEFLFKNGRYDWCLFIAHLVLEKTLKAFYVRDNGKNAPTHSQIRYSCFTHKAKAF